MINIVGQYSTATVFSDNVDPSTYSQILQLCNQEFTKDTNIRVMPDCHAGAGCVVGTTMLVQNAICPNLVGVDIGCGIDVTYLGNLESIDFQKLDKVILGNVPSGFHIKNNNHLSKEDKESAFALTSLLNAKGMDTNRAELSVGTLGGGNHFVEIDKGEDGYYLLIHSGSRNIGLSVATYWQKIAEQTCTDNVPRELKYLENDNLGNYLSDVAIMTDYAELNRRSMAKTICKMMEWEGFTHFSSIHNSIFYEYHNDKLLSILRKGATPANAQMLVIPINMRDGSLICVGKENKDWNYSAPHGAGRLMSRSKAKENLSLEEFQTSMNGIYSTCIRESTLDESPMAYKPMEEIVANIDDTVTIGKIIKPVYNFKAG